MKNYFLVTFLLFKSASLLAQQNNIDSLFVALERSTTIEQQIFILKQLSNQQNTAPLIIKYSQQGITLSKKANLPVEEEYFLSDLCRGYHKNDNYPKELETSLAGLQLSQQLNDQDRFCEFAFVILICYDQGTQYDKAIAYGLMGLHVAEKTKNLFRLTQLCNYISHHYIAIGRLDSALKYMRRSNQEAVITHSPNIGFSLYGLGVIQEKLHHLDSALYYYERAVPAFKASNIFRTTNLIDAYTGIAGIYKNKSDPDSALHYATMAFELSKEANQFNSTYEAAEMLASLYDGKNDKKALFYFKIAVVAKDSILTADKIKQMLILSDNEEQRREKLIESFQRRRDYLLLAIGLLFVLFSLIFYLRRSRLKKKLEIEKIRTNIAADFHDELGSTLSSIALYTEIANNDDFSNTRGVKNILLQIAESSRKTVLAMQDMIWSIQPKNDTMKDIIFRVREFAYPLAELQNINLQFNIEAGAELLSVLMEDRKNIYLIFKEALNNAFKYSSASNITIHIRKRDQLINMQIKDDGTGFDIQKIRKGNGLRNMIKRANQLRGLLLIESGAQDGTSISFTCSGK
jgi:two-component system, NarL family, sensor histidine kinase UhpB